jgi:hypothetical protein
MDQIEDAVRPHLNGGERDDLKHESNKLPILRRYTPAHLSEEKLDQYQALRREREVLRRNPPRAAEMALCVTEDGSLPPATHILLRGSPHSIGEPVAPAFPSVLVSASAAPPILPPAGQSANTSGRRRVLADWIASPDNPLTARVLVNRVWQYHFGRGIVRSSSNFGYLGTPPTHPELLDWLASEFVKSGMRLKALHRLMVTSSAFRMSGQIDPAAAAQDPENDLLSHFDLRRLSAEEIRDSILAICGNLNLEKRGGPSIYPEIAKEVLAGQSRPGYGWSKSSPQDAAARSIFVHIKRSLAVPILQVFDAPDPDAPCPVRFSTTQAAQSLGLLNSDFVNSQAEIFARQVAAQAGSEPAEQVRLVLRRVTQRRPTQAEVDRGLAFLRVAQTEDHEKPEEALRRFCLLALNLNEFVYLE